MNDNHGDPFGGGWVEHTVVVAEKIAESGIETLRRTCHVDVAVGLERGALLERLAGAAGLVVRSATQVDAELLASAPALQVIGRAGIGVDNIDLDAATAAGIVVVNAPQANIISAAEHALALLLAQARNIPLADGTLRSGVWDRSRFQGVELHGKILGVLGLGRIGTLVAQRAGAFGMRVLAYDPYVSEDRARRLGTELADLDTVLSTSDFLSIHLPKTADTAGLVGKEALAKVKPGIRIVNAARGGILDEDALAEALRDGRVAGAALDVFSSEPLTESPLFEMPNVVVTPHLGASTAEAQDKAGTDVAEAVAAALRGELVMSAVNVDLGASVPEEVADYLPVAESLGQVFTGLAQGLPERLTVRVEGVIGGSNPRPLALAVLRGALSPLHERAVTFVNAPGLADQQGMSVDQETSDVADDYQSVVGVRGRVGDHDVSVKATLSRKGPALVEILGNDLELPVSEHMLIVRNEDVPGVIGRVGAFLGDLDVNIANMVVGQSQVTGHAAMMGISVDRPLTDRQLDDLRRLEGIHWARSISVS